MTGPAKSRLRQKLRAFWRDNCGTMSIEAAMWIPMFFFMLTVTVDATLVINAKSEVLRIIQDANRSYAVGRLTSVPATRLFIQSRLSKISPHAVVTTTVASGIVSSVVTMPATDLSGLGTIPNFANIQVRVSSQQMVES